MDDKLRRTPEELAELREERAWFSRHRPGLEDLSPEEYDGPYRQGDILALLSALAGLKRANRATGAILMSDLPEVPPDDPRLADDPLYAAMTPGSRREHRQMLWQMDQWRARREEYVREHPPAPSFEERVLTLLQSIDDKLRRMLEEP